MEAVHIWLDRQLPEGWLDLQPHGALQPPCNPIHLQYLLTYHLPTQSHVGYSSRSGCNHGRTKEINGENSLQHVSKATYLPFLQCDPLPEKTPCDKP